MNKASFLAISVAMALTGCGSSNDSNALMLTAMEYYCALIDNLVFLPVNVPKNIGSF